MNNFHKPVLLKEVLEYLNIEPGKKYIDATLGGGGHTEEILREGGKVLGIDVDNDAIDFTNGRKDKIVNSQNLTLVRGNFREIEKIARLNSFDRVAGIIFDLGVSSFQIDSRDRGFSYQKNSPLDMRMDRGLSVKAADLINVLTKGELNELFSKLGEEHNSRVISERIIRARGIKKIETTDDLIEAITSRKNKRVSAFERAQILRKIFQALRIAVNDELNSLKEGLPGAVELLEREGRLAVISFHSLEDRIVKQTFEDFSKKGRGLILTKKPIVPSVQETNVNRRGKSAKMRVFRKI